MIPSGEFPLIGGTANAGEVVRVDDTVRRPTQPGSQAVHALLRHLEEVGFDGAPRYLGQDDRGREVLSYIDGVVATAPPPAWALTDNALTEVAGLLRRYHEATQTFDPSRFSWSTTVPSPYRGRLVSHNDPNLDNVVFRDGHAAALIDFDLASPGSALWDAALAARLWVPLRAPQDINDERQGLTTDRLRLFADAYELTAADRARLVEAALCTHDWCYAIVRRGAQGGKPGYVAYWAAAQERAERGRDWLALSAPTLTRALVR